MSFHYSPKIITEGLVLYLDAANTRSYPGVGTTWSDLSRSENTGTLINGPTFNSANGGSIVFDGTNDLVEITGIENITSFSISVWFKMTGPGNTGGFTNTYYNSLFGINSVTNPTTRRILVSTSTNPSIAEGRILVQMGGSNYFSDNTSIGITTTNAWNNVVYTFAANTARLYINGIVQTSQSNSGVTFPFVSDSKLYVGAYSNPIVAYAMLGNIAQTQIYNRALSASEVLQNYNATKTRFGL
jgi:hypothetical protein